MKTAEDRRLELHELLLTMGASKVYFQPPGKERMVYPCIVYKRARANTIYADDAPYNVTRAYNVTVIDEDPDSPIVEKMMGLRLCSHERHFVSDNLHHDVFILYY